MPFGSASRLLVQAEHFGFRRSTLGSNITFGAKPSRALARLRAIPLPA